LYYLRVFYVVRLTRSHERIDTGPDRPGGPTGAYIVPSTDYLV